MYAPTVPQGIIDRENERLRKKIVSAIRCSITVLKRLSL
jgi:uncharacterized protein YaaN involved in tellurite resistance